METLNDYKLLKKHYTEKFAQLCRDLFPTILETPGKLYELISSLFAPNKFLYDDLLSENSINKFKDYIYKEYDKDVAELKHTTKTPEELLDEVGYILYECKTEVDIQSFRKYYRRNDGKVPVYKEGTKPEIHNGEELCTFNGGRLDSCYVFFAVKKNVDEIKREDFKNPKRQDKYGTSVISIQFTRGDVNHLSIKNRYNHTIVDCNPDATFSNDLDNIIAGLTDAFVKKYGFNLEEKRSSDFGLPGYVLASDGRFYKYNYEIDNVYYCVDNIVIENHEPKQYDKAKYIVFENMILNLQNKHFDNMDEHFSEIKINKIEQRVNSENGTRDIIINDNIVITLDNQNRIISYINPEVEKIGDSFLNKNKVLKYIELSNVTKIGDDFLSSNKSLISINLPKVNKIGSRFLFDNNALECVELPEVQKIGHSFIDRNRLLTSISLPKVEEIGDFSLTHNRVLRHIELPNAKIIGSYFLCENEVLTSISLPKVEEIGPSFLKYNEVLNHIELPKVISIGGDFLKCNTALTHMELPNVEFIDYNFLLSNEVLMHIDLPNVKKISTNFLASNEALKYIELPLVEKIEVSFLYRNRVLKSISLPNLITVYDGFLYNNKALKSISLPKLEIIYGSFLFNNRVLNHIELPKVISIGDDFLKCNTALTSISLPNVEHIKDSFLCCNKGLLSIDLPSVIVIGDSFLFNNLLLGEINLPNIKVIGKSFMKCNARLRKVVMPDGVTIGNDFLCGLFEEFPDLWSEIIAKTEPTEDLTR